MSPKQKSKLKIVILMMLGLVTAFSLIIYALSQNINLYFTPEELQKQNVMKAKNIKLGGLVKKNSIKQQSGLKIEFMVTDYTHDVLVQYDGILPDLFKEGQGVIVMGDLFNGKVFVANQVLAKHDENYMPPGVL